MIQTGYWRGFPSFCRAKEKRIPFVNCERYGETIPHAPGGGCENDLPVFGHYFPDKAKITGHIVFDRFGRRRCLEIGEALIADVLNCSQDAGGNRFCPRPCSRDCP